MFDKRQQDLKDLRPERYNLPPAEEQPLGLVKDEGAELVERLLRSVSGGFYGFNQLSELCPSFIRTFEGLCLLFPVFLTAAAGCAGAS